MLPFPLQWPQRLTGSSRPQWLGRPRNCWEDQSLATGCLLALDWANLLLQAYPAGQHWSCRCRQCPWCWSLPDGYLQRDASENLQISKSCSRACKAPARLKAWERLPSRTGPSLWSRGLQPQGWEIPRQGLWPANPSVVPRSQLQEWHSEKLRIRDKRVSCAGAPHSTALVCPVLSRALSTVAWLCHCQLLCHHMSQRVP